MSVKNKNEFNVTLEYGQGYNEIDEKDENKISKNFDFTQKFKNNVLDYHIHKIIYTLNNRQSIQTLKMVYKNRNDGHLETLLEAGKNEEKKEEYEIEFEDFEEITNIFFYITKDKLENLAAICIETSKGRSKYIGNQDKGDITKDSLLNSGQNIVLGFGVNWCESYGVTSIYAYSINKHKFGLCQYSGFFQLRAKLKNDLKFKEQLELKKSTLDEKQKLIFEICDLPDSTFFPIASYIISL